MVHVYEVYPGSCAGSCTREQLRGFFDKRVGHFLHTPAGQFIAIVKSGVQQGDIHLFHFADDVLVPLTPFVYIRYEEVFLLPGMNNKPGSFRIFVAVRNGEGLYAYNGGQPCEGIRRQLYRFYILQGDQLLPGAVLLQEAFHFWQGIYFYLFCPQRLAAQLRQSRIVAHMGMGDEYAVRQVAVFIARQFIEILQLLFDIWRCFKQPPLFRIRVDQGKGHNVTPVFRMLPGLFAALLPAPDVRVTAVLCYAEYLNKGLAVY